MEERRRYHQIESAWSQFNESPRPIQVLAFFIASISSSLSHQGLGTIRQSSLKYSVAAAPPVTEDHNSRSRCGRLRLAISWAVSQLARVRIDGGWREVQHIHLAKWAGTLWRWCAGSRRRRCAALLETVARRPIEDWSLPVLGRSDCAPSTKRCAWLLTEAVRWHAHRLINIQDEVGYKRNRDRKLDSRIPWMLQNNQL